MLILILPAFAASLDNLEVGGPWGTPTATGGTAAWWNPAALAAGSGTRIELEVAPTFANVAYIRDDPHGGTDIYKLFGPLPFVGIATDFGVPGLGFGATMAVPYVRGGTEVDEPGPGAGHMRDGKVQAIYFLAGGAYQIADRLAIGLGGGLVRSSWIARVNNDTLPSLKGAIEDAGGVPTYTDADLEDPDYNATLQFDELSALAFTWNAGLRLKLDPDIAIGVSYVHGVTVDNTGGVAVLFACPPDSDTLGQTGAQTTGTCNTLVHADASVAYTLPSRVQAGLSWEPGIVRLELMGGWVHWSVYDDFHIAVTNADLDNAQGKALLEQSRLWARDNQDSGWGGLDVKVHPAKPWTVGGRLLYDASAIPDAVLSTNNYDANAWMLSGMVAVRPLPQLEFAASWTHHFLAERTVTDSAFYQTIDGTPPADRYNYPQANGTYSGTIDRIGIQAKIYLGEKADTPVKPARHVAHRPPPDEPDAGEDPGEPDDR